MLSFAKNERGVRLISAAIILLPLACLVYTTSRSDMVNTIVALGYCIFAAIALMAFLYERAEEEDVDDRA